MNKQSNNRVEILPLNSLNSSLGRNFLPAWEPLLYSKTQVTICLDCCWCLIRWCHSHRPRATAQWLAA